MHDQLLGSTQPVLSISLDPGESIVGETGGFAWMTDSIQMVAAPRHDLDAGPHPVALSAYTAKGAGGTVAFAAKVPGSILGVEVAPEREYLVHRCAFLAGTPGIELTTGLRQPLPAAAGEVSDFTLRRIAGRGRAWVELSGDVVRRDLAAGTSLRTRPWHIGMCDASVTIQVAELPAPSSHSGSDPTHQFAVLSGPGSVWLQSMQLLASAQARLTASSSGTIPTAEGAAGQAAAYRDAQHAINP